MAGTQSTAKSRRAAPQPPAAQKRPRGRRPSLTRERIVAEALSLLKRAPLAEFSLARLASSLGITTMGLYTYFASRDELLDAAADHVLGLFAAPPPTGRWQDDIDAWLWAVQRHFDRYPVALELLAWDRHVSAAWLRVIEPVAAWLERAGFRGRRLAFALNWFLHSAIGSMQAFGKTSEWRLEDAIEAQASGTSMFEPGFMAGMRGVDRDAMLGYTFRRIVQGLAALHEGPLPRAPRGTGARGDLR
jgi:AcrR family transcriptional regulator